MSTKERKPTDVEMTMLDFESVLSDPYWLESAQKILDDRHGEGTYEVTDLRMGLTWAAFEKPNGDLFLLSTEGVGMPFDEGMGVTLEVNVIAGDRWFMSAIAYRPTRKDIYDLMTTETVNLAEFIRRFGARLEYNYELWRKELEAA